MHVQVFFNLASLILVEISVETLPSGQLYLSVSHRDPGSLMAATARSLKSTTERSWPDWPFDL